MYSTFFVNNKTYGADDINKVFAHLTTQGVSLFNDTGDALIDLDTAMANLVNPGVDIYNNNSCKVVSAGNGYYKISKGCCWMPSGACIIFDDDGYVFELNFLDSTGTKGTTCYVYLRQGGDESEGVSNEINIIVSGEAPADGDMPIGTISSSGKVVDTRIFAQAKIAVPTTNIFQTFDLSVSIKSNQEYDILTYELPYSGFNYIWISKSAWTSSQVGKIFELPNDEFIYIHYPTSSSAAKLMARKVSSILEIKVVPYGTNVSGSNTYTESVTINVI